MKEERRVSEYISDFLNFVEQSKKDYTMAVNGEQRQNDLTQDIMHKIELEHLTYGDRAKIVTQLRKVRKDRRGYKDHMELLEPIIKYSEENKRAMELLKQLLGQVRKIETRHENRVYTPRIKQDT